MGFLGFAGGTSDNLWMDHEVEMNLDIPLEVVTEERNRRQAALEKFLRHQEACKKNPDLVQYAPSYDIRHWWEGRWVKRTYLPEGEIREWRTYHLKGDDLEKARNAEPNSDVRIPGNKILPAGRAYFRLVPRLGMCVFAGENDLPEYTILGAYVGELFCDETLAKHKCQDDSEASHKLSLRHRATMPATVSGIKGGPIQPKGQKFDLRYFWKNGPGSMLNSRSRNLCNCAFVVEYPHSLIYENAPALHVDDEYCDPRIPYSQRVLPEEHAFSILSHTLSHFEIIHI